MFQFVPSDKIKVDLDPADWAMIATADVIGEMVLCHGAFAYDIVADGNVIGFALFRNYGDGLFLWQYAIDKNFQHRGYGCGALRELLSKLHLERNVSYFTTTYSWGNYRAKKLYEKLGFTETDVVDEEGVHEVNMELYYPYGGVRE